MRYYIVFMYIYKKRIGSKVYYYLRISKREGNKIISKDIAKLGSDPDKIRDKLKDLESEYSSEIRKSHRTLNRTIEHEHFLKKTKKLKLKKIELLSDREIFEIEAAKMHFEKKIKKLDKKTYEQFIDYYISEYAWHTASIEGNTIPLDEAEKFFFENKSPKDVSVEEIYDLKNNKDALKEVFFNFKKLDVDHDTIKKLHAIIMKDVDVRIGYRKFDVRILGSRFESSPHQYILTDMNELLKWYCENENKMNPFVLTTLFHHRFEQIHPFADGNGRCGRLLLNLILLKKNYPPLLVQRKNRELYRDSLSKADSAHYKDLELKNYKELFSYFAFEIENTYWKYFE